MPATTSTTREQRWLRTRLSTVGLPVYRGQAPETATFPCIIFRNQGGTDVVNLAGTFMVRSIWLVFVAGKAPFQAESQASVNTLETYADSMHAAIYKPNITVVNGRNIEECRSESPWFSSVVENGTEYIQIGNIYRILTTTA